MADTVLCMASIGLTICISKQVGKQLSSRLPSITVALGLSLGLFSLSILEAAPSSWLAVLQQQQQEQDASSSLTHHEHISITTAYRWLLWILCLWIILVLPALAGGRLLATLAERRAQVDDPEQKYLYQWQQHWIVRYSWRILSIPPSILMRITMAIFRRLRRKSILPRTVEPTVLVMTDSRHGPSSKNHVSLKASQSRQSFFVGGLCAVLLTMMMLRALGSFVIRSSHGDNETTHLLPTMVSWLCAVGLLLSSALNGFGSVSLPHSCLAGIYLEPIRPEVIAQAKVQLETTSSALSDKRAELTADFPSTTRSQHRQAIQKDIDFLETLVEELAEDIEEMKHSQEAAARARTTVGKVRSWIGVVFSLVLLIRLYTSMANIWRAPNTTRRGDPITTGLLWLTGHNLVSQQDYNALSQCISLLLTAFLSASQVRMFLRTMHALNLRLARFCRKCKCKSTRISRTPPTTEARHYHVHLWAVLMGCYFLSCLVLTKMNLPLEYRSSFTAAMGGTEFVVQSKVANSVFCSSAVISAVVLGLLFGIQRQNTKRHVVDDTLGNLDSC